MLALGKATRAQWECGPVGRAQPGRVWFLALQKQGIGEVEEGEGSTDHSWLCGEFKSSPGYSK